MHICLTEKQNYGNDSAIIFYPTTDDIFWKSSFKVYFELLKSFIQSSILFW